MSKFIDDNAYYNEYARAYFDKTSALDSSFFLTPFISTLDINSSVLDLGCGSGRDLLWLKTMGFRPIGFERSPVLAQMARDHSGCPVVEGDFESYDFFSFQVNALLFSASLVHIPHTRVGSVLDNALYALAGQGTVYISLKEGEGVSYDGDSRRFFLWKDGDIRMIFKELGLMVVDFRSTRSVRGADETWLSYTLYFDKNKPLFRYPDRLIL
jgi:SAM-dependent methyltransferase